MTDSKRNRVRRSLRDQLARERRERREARLIFEGSMLMRLAEDGLAQPMELRVVARW